MRRTCRAFAYLLLGLPLGIAYFTCLVTLLALGLGLAVTVVGLPILLETLRLGRGMAAFDLQLTQSLLSLETPRVPAATAAGRGWRRRLLDREAWAETAYLLLRLPLGVIDFSIAVSFVAYGLYLLFMPVIEAAGAITFTAGSWSVNSQARAWMLVPGGVLLLLVSPHVISGVAFLSARLAPAMLGRMDYKHLRSEVLGMLRPEVELTGPALLGQLRLHHGASADFTAKKVFVVLSELERGGLAHRKEDRPLDRYSLSPAGEAATRLSA